MIHADVPPSPDNFMRSMLPLTCFQVALGQALGFFPLRQDTL